MNPGPAPVAAPRWVRFAVTATFSLLVVGTTVGAAVDGWIVGPTTASAVAAAITVVGLAALVGRARRPALTVGIEIVVAVAATVAAPDAVHGAPTLELVVALYAYGTRTRPLPNVVASVIAGAALAGANLARPGHLGDVLPAFVLVTAVTAVTFYVRSQRELLVSYRERAEAAEREQRWSAARAVAAERVRIARELHDIVAHHVSLLVVQAGAVRESLPDGHVARGVLDSMISGGRQAMGEMRDMLDALRLDERVDEEVGGGPARTPQPDLGAVTALVEGAVAAGQPVTLQVEGAAPALVPGDRPGRLPDHPGGAHQRRAPRPRGLHVRAGGLRARPDPGDGRQTGSPSAPPPARRRGRGTGSSACTNGLRWPTGR